jgi:hypothetical protein
LQTDKTAKKEWEFIGRDTGTDIFHADENGLFPALARFLVQRTHAYGSGARRILEGVGE